MLKPQGFPMPRREAQLALVQLLRKTLTRPAQFTLYASAPGAILVAAASGGEPTAIIGTVITQVGFNVLADILGRVARGEDVADEEAIEKLEFAIDQSTIAQELEHDRTQAMVGRLFFRLDALIQPTNAGCTRLYPNPRRRDGVLVTTEETTI